MTTPPVNRVLNALYDRGFDPKSKGNGWAARCPAHDDQKPSLSISEGDDGRVLVKCHAGCRTEYIVAALGLKMRDLMPVVPNAKSSTARTGVSGNKSYSSGDRQIFATVDEAMKTLQSRRGRASGVWRYTDAEGELVGMVLRWDSSNGKIIWA